jgi:hypothetical protein
MPEWLVLVATLGDGVVVGEASAVELGDGGVAGAAVCEGAANRGPSVEQPINIAVARTRPDKTLDARMSTRPYYECYDVAWASRGSRRISITYLLRIRTFASARAPR